MKRNKKNVNRDNLDLKRSAEHNGDNAEITPKNGRTKTEVFLLALFIIFLIIFCVTGYKLFVYYKGNTEQAKVDKEISDIRLEILGDSDTNADDSNIEDTVTVEKTVDSADKARLAASKLKQINEDYQCFLSIDDTSVYYPVVKRDNVYYLKHNFKNESNSRGAIFMDESCELSDDLIILHGHHMRDGTMFGALKGYRKEAFRKEHSAVYLDYGAGDVEYEVFCVALIDVVKEGHFAYYDLANVADLDMYLKGLKNSSFYFQDISAKLENYKDSEVPKIVLMSTCEYGGDDQRLVVGAVLK